MKRIVSFLRSMKFGVILLLWVMAFSIFGSLMPQGREAAWYLQNHPALGPFLVSAGLDNVFTSWYFAALMGLLCLNLTLCSVLRLGRVRRLRAHDLRAAAALQNGRPIPDGDGARVRAYLLGQGFRAGPLPRVFTKNQLGYYGSFLVHLSLLMILVFGGLVLRLSHVTDYNVMPGTVQVLPDGTQLFVESFRTADPDGRTEYASVIQVTAPDGQRSETAEIRVNTPLTFQGHKYYQHSYGTAGRVTARNRVTGGADVFPLTESSFLSVDGRNGIWFDTLYPGYVEDEDGHITPITIPGGGYPDPVYRALVSHEGEMTAVMARPGETYQAGEIDFTFEAPVTYPGIRVKDVPRPFPALLYLSFALMVAGFWLCFFHTPAAVGLGCDCVAVAGQKTAGVQLALDELLAEGEE